MNVGKVGALLLVAGTLLALPACGGSSSADKRKGTTPSTAKITSFVVPATASCGGATSTTVTVQYGTAGAAKEVLSVDGRPTTLTTASGSVTVPVHCDPLPHTFVLFAYDSHERYTSQEKKLMTQ